MPVLVQNLGQDKFAISNSTLKVLKAYINISHNIETVMNGLVREGLTLFDPNARIKVLESIPVLI